MGGKEEDALKADMSLDYRALSTLCGSFVAPTPWADLIQGKASHIPLVPERCGQYE
jgi:hypothetical protein